MNQNNMTDPFLKCKCGCVYPSFESVNPEMIVDKETNELYWRWHCVQCGQLYSRGVGQVIKL